MTNDDLPLVFVAADADAGQYQRRHFLIQRVELIALVASAVALQLSWVTSRFNLAALFGAAILALALGTRILGRLAGYETRWRRSRSRAEAAKAMAWQFAVGSGEYPTSLQDEEAQALLAETMSRLSDVEPTAPAGIESYLTEGMRSVRKAPSEERRQAYLEHRLHEQRRWYAKTASRNQRATLLWSTVVATLEALALGMAFAVGFKWFEFDWAGVLGAAAAAGLAWHQAKQHSYIAASYNAVCQNLDVLEPRFHDQADPEGWVALVWRAEELFASEHALWRHRRAWS